MTRAAPRFELLGTCVAVALLCVGCDAIPGTSSYREAKAKRAVAEQLIDPTTAQFRNLQVRGDHVCGEVNGKNKMGAYVGFTRFVVDTTEYEAQIDPQFDYASLLSARDLCTAMSSNSYSSLSSTMSACGRVTELEAERRSQEAFDVAWKADCSGGAVRQVYQPPLSAGTASDPASEDDNLSTSNLPDEASIDTGNQTSDETNQASAELSATNDAPVANDADVNESDSISIIDD